MLQGAVVLLWTFTEGDILVDGRSMLDLPPEKRNVGMVFQGYSLFPHMSVAENVAFPLKLRRYGKSEIVKRVEQALDMVRLGEIVLLWQQEYALSASGHLHRSPE